MPVREVENLEELATLEGSEVAVGDWFEVTQECINRFADATEDHQWIHVDVERCERESRFGGPIAHGYLTLSLLPALIARAFKLKQEFDLIVNFGMNKLRFMAPVLAGSRVRVRMKLVAVQEVEKGHQVNWRMTVDIEGTKKPAFIAQTMFRYY